MENSISLKGLKFNETEQLGKEKYPDSYSREILASFLVDMGGDVFNNNTATCPYHTDTNPSASIHEDNGHWRFKCHVPTCGVSGDIYDLREKAGINPCFTSGVKQYTKKPHQPTAKAKAERSSPKATDYTLKKTGKPESKRKEVAHYDYKDESGTLLSQKVRYEPKGFTQRKPDGKDGWIYKLGETRRVPYRLPELLKALEVNPEETVFIVEGEKDVETLRALGLISTTNPDGAGKWHIIEEEAHKVLAGHPVVILPDNDDPGQKHCEDIAQSLSGIASSIKVLNLPGLPDKGDGSDWIEAGGTVEELNRLVSECPEWIPAQAVESSITNQPGNQTTADAEKVKTPPAVELLLSIAEQADLIFTPNEEAYVSIPVDSHREIYPIASKTYRNWLAYQYRTQYKKPPQPETLQQAISQLEAEAQFSENTKRVEVHLRTAVHEGNIYLDLCNDKWEAIKISPDKVDVISTPPVLFHRNKDMKSLPCPVSGDISLLRKFINVKSEEDFLLLISWMVAAMRPGFAFPILVLQGEPGSAKTTTSRIIRDLIDPNEASYKSFPKEEKDLMISATHGWILSFDNLSHITAAVSDNLCKMSTGAGFSSRKLFTDGDEQTIFVKRPVILNGITDFISRTDLLDRCITIELEPIPDAKRVLEETLSITALV